MKNKDIKAQMVDNLRHPWVIIDSKTGEILDDAQGYGYRTAQKAHAAYSYKNRTPSQKSKAKAQKRLAKNWWSKHKKERNSLIQFEFEIAKGSWGPDDKFDYAFFRDFIAQNNIDVENIDLRALWRYYRTH